MIRIRICNNDEILGTKSINIEQIIEETYYNSINIYLIPTQDFSYWNGGPGYGCGFVAVEIPDWGVVKTLTHANQAVVWLANTDRSFPSSEEIKEAFEVAEEINEAIKYAKENHE